MTPDELQARILYRDGLAIIIDKPTGIAVHAGPGGGDNLEKYFGALRFGLPRPPGLAHRLDRETSGCLVLGRHPKALSKLGKLFAGGRAQKTYWAIVEGSPRKTEGRISLRLKKQTPKQGWSMIVAKDGQDAVTEYKVMGKANGLTWLELTPRTGRTHQIRVHCASMGCPVVGDWLYGSNSNKETRAELNLHSRAISLPLYTGRPPIRALALPPPHMLEALKACGYDPTTDKLLPQSPPKSIPQD